MPSVDLLIAFVLAASVFAWMPGPGMLYAAAQTLARGRKAGWRAAIGIHIGGYAHVVAAAFGLAITFQTIPVLYTFFKIAGAAYLLWLGAKMLLDRTPLTAPEEANSANSSPPAFRESVLVEVLNPKTALFYLAFLPQFTDPAAILPVWGQLLILGTVVNIMFSSGDVISVVLADKVMTSLQGASRTALLAKRVGGTVLIGLGINLALSRQ